MLQVNMQNNISEIESLFNNYEYMKKNQTQLEQLKNEIIKIIKKLEDLKNPSIVDLVFKYQKSIKNKDSVLTVKDVTNTTEFYQYCYDTHNNFVKFLNKIKSRLETLEAEQPELTNAEKNEFYHKIGDYIVQDEVELLEELLNKNLIDVNYVPPMENENFSVPLIIRACGANNLAIVKMLHNNNANLNVNINDNYINDVSPLLLAIINRNDNELISYLLDNGASPNFIGGDAKTPLNAAIDDLELYERMIKKYGANVNLRFQNETILNYACEKHKFGAIKILLANGANVNFRDNENCTALHVLFSPFIHEGEIADIKEIIDLFIAKNFDFNAQNNSGDTPIHNLVYSTWGITLIKYLLSKDINYDVNLVNEYDESVIHNLFNHYRHNDLTGIIEIFNWFINHNFIIDCINDSGETILYQAVKRQIDSIMIEYLLIKGANMNIANNAGKTVLQLAKESKNPEILKVINKYSKLNLKNK